MSCCSDCNEQGMGWLGLGDISIVGGRVVPGTVVSWGGYVLYRDSRTSINGWHSDIDSTVRGILWGFDVFSSVSARQIAGWNNPYISIQVTTKREFSYLGDIYEVINGAIESAGYIPQPIDFRVDSVPAGTPQTPQVSQPGRAGGAVQQPDSSWSFPTISLPNLSDIFGGSSSPSNNGNPIDSLANWLGVTPTQAGIVGAGLAIGGVILLKRLL